MTVINYLARAPRPAGIPPTPDDVAQLAELDAYGRGFDDGYRAGVAASLARQAEPPATPAARPPKTRPARTAEPLNLHADTSGMSDADIHAHYKRIGPFADLEFFVDHCGAYPDLAEEGRAILAGTTWTVADGKRIAGEVVRLRRAWRARRNAEERPARTYSASVVRRAWAMLADAGKTGGNSTAERRARITKRWNDRRDWRGTVARMRAESVETGAGCTIIAFWPGVTDDGRPYVRGESVRVGSDGTLARWSPA